MQQTYVSPPPGPASLIFLPALFPSPRLGEVEREGAAASTRDAIKDPAYHASQDAAGIATPLAEDEARDDVHVHIAQGECAEFSLVRTFLCAILILWDGD